LTAPATPEAAEWEGWGTALKPAFEPIVLARKPLSEKTVAANVLQHGTGAINIDGCRVGVDDAEREIIDNRSGANSQADDGLIYGNGLGNRAQGTTFKSHTQGRFPANVITDGSDEVVAAFPESSGGSATERSTSRADGYGLSAPTIKTAYEGEGSAARFFYSAKADSDDRLGSKHPTVKPVDLMQWLVRLVTPKGGLVLDPFAGTGTTAEACYREGMNCMMVEREAEYQADIRRRMKLILSGPDERSRESIKAKVGDIPFEDGTLFANLS
jgi:DNA methylase